MSGFSEVPDGGEVYHIVGGERHEGWFASCDRCEHRRGPAAALITADALRSETDADARAAAAASNERFTEYELSMIWSALNLLGQRTWPTDDEAAREHVALMAKVQRMIDRSAEAAMVRDATVDRQH